MPAFGRRQFLALGASGLVSACSLPRGAARESEILSSAEADTLAGYAIYPVTRAFLPQVETWPVTGSGPRGSWIAHQRGSSSQIIAPGDIVDVVIWDSEENSLLTSPGSKVVTLPQMRVAPNGTIFMPYLDSIHVGGMTPQAARAKIQSEMAAIIPSAQIQLSMQSGRKNSVDLVGGVGSPGTYPMVDRDLTVLSLISLGGGVLTTLENPVVRLVRNGQLYVTTVARLYADPSLDTTLAGGDKVIVEEDPRSFIAIGAAGREQLVQFPKDTLSALDAIALIGGISDTRADPQGILILREYPESATRAGVQGPRETRAIFVIDLTTADGLFSAKRFQINPDDVVYASESPLTTVQTITQTVGSLFGIARQVDRAF
ncbi:polysaccharide biosynthesis/export family protein [Actibacterium sp. MT2.3-13A]|uniref:polysaccharide biosynthesis/export family protein n=1 Tax=Actibacterium sp. MT2.3-13A TaxID=2828332 RepID=UPI001BA7ADF6|nr:polysaccharide biosynthesis/export family protein [Actibacterium sp. MT2.3-13A]